METAPDGSRPTVARAIRGLALVALIAGLAGGVGDLLDSSGTYLYNFSGSRFMWASWVLASGFAIMVGVFPATAFIWGVVKEVRKGAAVRLSLGATYFVPVIIAEEQPSALLAVVVALLPFAALGLVRRPPAALAAWAVPLAAVLVVAHFVGLAIVARPATFCNFEDCYRSLWWQTTIAVAFLWLAVSHLLTEPTVRED